MIYPEAKLEDWIEKYGLIVKPWTCVKCGGHFETTVPILMQDCAGLETPAHGCGPGFTKVILTPRTDKAKAFWKEVLS